MDPRSGTNGKTSPSVSYSSTTSSCSTTPSCSPTASCSCSGNGGGYVRAPSFRSVLNLDIQIPIAENGVRGRSYELFGGTTTMMM